MIIVDYLTKSATRQIIRGFAPIFRNLSDAKADGPFPVLEALEKVPDVFKGSNVEIVVDWKLPKKTVAQCEPHNDGTFTIKIQESVYVGAYDKNIWAYQGHICHELCHGFLWSIGYQPIMTRSFDNGEIPAYCSAEWQAKALCGEVMVPYEASIGMSKEEIIAKYHVSKGIANYRQKY